MRNGLRIYSDGSKRWFLNDLLHRLDGPAIEYPNGYKRWYIEGQLHREDGPAIDGADGIKFWFIKNKRVQCTSQEEFERLIKLKAFW